MHRLFGHLSTLVSPISDRRLSLENARYIDSIVRHFHTDVLEDYPKAMIFTTIDLPLPSGDTAQFYRFRWPSSELVSTLKVIEPTRLNSPPIARFPDHLSMNMNKDFVYSLDVFDPDGDPFDCVVVNSSLTITIDSPCTLTIKGDRSFDEDLVFIQMELIEYVDETKKVIRSRLPYHSMVFITHADSAEKCRERPSIALTNVENDVVHVLMSESMKIGVVSRSACPVEMEECSMLSGFHWKTRSLVETILADQHSEIHFEFEWTPRLNEHCGFHLHCIRCVDQSDNYEDRCLTIYVDGHACRQCIRLLDVR